MIKFVESQKTGEYVLITEEDMDFNTRFAKTFSEMKEEKRKIERALTTFAAFHSEITRQEDFFKDK